MTNKFMTGLIRILSFALIAVILFSAAGGLGTHAYAEEGDGSLTVDSQNTSGSYAPVDVDAQCSLTVYPCGKTSEAFDDLKNNASMTVDLYMIASAVAISGVDSYDYSLESDFSSLSSLLAEARKVNGSSNWEKLAQEAAKIAKVKTESLSNTATKDKEAESVRALREYNAEIISAVEYRMRIFGETQEIAEEKIRELKESEPAVEQIVDNNKE